MALVTAPNVWINGDFADQYIMVPVEASTAIWQGQAVAFNGTTGCLIPAQNVSGAVLAGYARSSANNSGGALGAIACQVTPLNAYPTINPSPLKVVSMNVSATPLTAQQLCGSLAYWTDDHTVATSGSSMLAGRIIAILAFGATGSVVIDTLGRTAL